MRRLLKFFAGWFGKSKRCCGLLVVTFLALQLLAQPLPSKPIKVEVRQNEGLFQLYRGGKPYYVKGAGGSGHLPELVAAGGNSIRTWGSNNGQKVLDSAHKYGLTVLMGLAVTPERHNFDYNDTAAVRKQFNRVKAEVIKYKDHPALLAWGIGNELNLQYNNPRVWNAVNDIATMIHEIDPHHPATTVLAGLNKREVDYIKAHCPALDLLSINIYGGLASLPGQVRSTGWEGAYLVTEWGPTGHWEGLQTTWKRPIEETSSEKAAVYKSRYLYSMERDKEKCLGSYVFLWGQKQERTPTWYGLFIEGGETTEVIDVLQFLWTGSWPQNKAPHLYSLQLNGQKATDNIYLQPGQSYSAAVVAFDPENRKVHYRWELLPEPTQLSEGGDFEGRPKTVPQALTNAASARPTVKAPLTKGAYRLFVYIHDDGNKVATANVPFYVQ